MSSNQQRLIDRRRLLHAAGTCAAAVVGQGLLAGRASASLEERPIPYTGDELILNGHRFFGSLSKGLAELVEKATRQWGRPNGYILGEEAGGAFIGGLRYGEGRLFTRNAGEERLFWQGPSIGFDTGADGDRTMMLVYGLPDKQAIFNRFAGVDGSAYFVGGLGMTALANLGITVVPIRTGVGVRLGANIGYLKFTPSSTWNPF